MDLGTTSQPVRGVAQHLGDLVRSLAEVPDLSTDYGSVATALQELLGVSASSVVDSRSGRSVVLVASPTETIDPQDATNLVLLPLVVRGTSFGALCLYSDSSRAWSEEELAIGALLADLVAGHLGNTAALREQKTLTGQLQTALDSRVLIEQAKGILAASENIGVDEAFTQLRDRARRTNRKLEAVAAEVITTGTSPR